MRASEMTGTAQERLRQALAGPGENGGSGVNLSLTPRAPRETADLEGAITRMLRGLANRGARGDLQAIVSLRRLDQVLALETLRAAQALQTDNGYSWAEIGVAAGISRQAAQQRWGG